jgi:hypothetical protein
LERDPAVTGRLTVLRASALTGSGIDIFRDWLRQIVAGGNDSGGGSSGDRNAGELDGEARSSKRSSIHSRSSRSGGILSGLRLGSEG